MTEPTVRLPNPEREDNDKPPEPTVDVVENLVSSGGFEGNPREIVENPAVTPEMPNEPGDLQIDMLEED